ncbi:MAG: tetratricopeptide repeat protein [Acidobacteriia bacterium]|nr:tetratricopeptide repeat protein [Terriglobia bacterium]
MNREKWAYLAGGVLLGALIGYGVFDFTKHPSASVSLERFVAAPPSEGAASTTGAPAASPAPSAAEVADLERVLHADPRNLGALKRLGNLMYDSGRWTESLDYYRRAIDLEPQDANVLTDAGICLRQLKRPDDALDYFRRAQAADPTHWQSLYNAAVVAGFDLGRFDTADEALRKLEKVNPGAPGLDRLRQDLAHAKSGRGAAS